MAVSNKFLDKKELIPGNLDVTKQTVIGFANIFTNSGLQNDLEETTKDLKIELEIDLSEIKNISAEIEIELKIANIASASIETDKEALRNESVNRDVLDYSIKSFNNQMQCNNRGDMCIETIDAAGMQGVVGSMIGGSISGGLKYIMENKKEIMVKAWEKLKQLYRALIKKVKEYYRKGFYALYKMMNLPTKILEKLSAIPSGQMITEDMLTEEIKLDLFKGFALFAVLNFKGENAYTFDFSNDIDRLRLEQSLSAKMFLDIAAAAKDGILPARDVDLLDVLSNKDVVKEFFNYAVPQGFSFEKSVIMPININTDNIGSKTPLLDYVIVNSAFYTEDVLDLTSSSMSVMRAVLKPAISEKIKVKLGTIGDLSRISNILVNFNANVLKVIEDNQDKGLSMLEKKVDSFDVDDKDMQEKFKVYKNIYDMLNVMSITNLMGLINTYTRAIRPLEDIADAVVSHNAKAAAGTQSEIKAGLQFFGLGTKYESNLTYTKVSDYLKGSGYIEAAWESLGSDVWEDEDFNEGYESLERMNDNYKRGSLKTDKFKKVSVDKFIVDPKKYEEYQETLKDIYEVNMEDIEITYEKEPELKKKALKFNDDMYKFLTKVHTLLSKNIRPMEK